MKGYCWWISVALEVRLTLAAADRDVDSTIAAWAKLVSSCPVTLRPSKCNNLDDDPSYA